jgi:hypothetical protein
MGEPAEAPALTDNTAPVTITIYDILAERSVMRRKCRQLTQITTGYAGSGKLHALARE